MGVAARLMFAAFFLFSSLYCLMAYVPFTYTQLLKSELIPALNLFARLHPALYWVVLLFGASAAGFARSRASAWFCGAHIVAGLLLFRWPVLQNLQNNTASLYWGFAMLIPVLWLAALDWQRYFGEVRWKPFVKGAAGVEPDDEQPVFAAAVATALAVSLTFGAVALFRRDAGDWEAGASVFGLVVSVASHILVFGVVFVLLNFLRVVASWFDTPVRWQFLLAHVLGVVATWGAFRMVVLPGISVGGPAGDAYGIAFGIAIAACFSGICLRIAAPRKKEEVTSGLALAFWCTGAPAVLPRWATAGLLIAIASTIGLVVSQFDWNFLVQKLATLLLWVAVFRLFYVVMRNRPMRAPSRTGQLLTCAMLMLPLYRVQEMSRGSVWKQMGANGTVAQFLSKWAGYDASFKLILDALNVDSSGGAFYQFLLENTNIAHSTVVPPVNIALAPLDKPATERPNIFVIVIDSLRQDYISAYNSSVDFTPNLGAFARESIVMKNAFTHYGGTGLSEPSIWLGGMMLHKQYITPFGTMNSLAKLMEKEKYQSYVSVDTILRVILPQKWAGMRELDEGRGTMDYDLCTTLGELDNRIQNESDGSSPIFAYTQPQNIHISVIGRAGNKSISNRNYGRFFAPYASRMERIDGCFGNFVAQLKKRGIYDNSIVIFTADHGDSLGEQGRWGHAYTIYPEIVKIPMIVHLPEAMKAKYHYDPETTAFSTDITPSLYYLTGHKPDTSNELFGRPLFVETKEELARTRRADYLIASSYGPVYGILTGDGGRLSISDAVNYHDCAFDMRASFTSGEETLGTAARGELQKKIKEKVLRVNGFYGFKGKGGE
ncbi:MAG: sulfatase-like hydrolase/transferase [Acidobacteria bacterium]|nr:sulfatase-like hydrolase/transferase [Acidobacteriota bacterium]